MIFFHVHLQSVTVKQSQTRHRHICCEHCLRDYYYLMSRTAVGYANDETEAGYKAATSRVVHKLDRIFKREDDPIACPHCGHFQSSMNLTIRRRYHAWIRKVAPFVIPVTIAIGLTLLIYTSTFLTDSDNERLWYSASWSLMFSGPFIASSMLLIRWLLARRIDLNAMADTARWTAGLPVPTLQPQTPADERE
ncbi:MAG: hypothetical protein ACYC26_05180 [Phycisphaerales bacterium]